MRLSIKFSMLLDKLGDWWVDTIIEQKYIKKTRLVFVRVYGSTPPRPPFQVAKVETVPIFPVS